MNARFDNLAERFRHIGENIMHSRAVRKSRVMVHRMSLPRSQGVPLYDIALYLWRGIFNGDLWRASKGLAFSFLTAIPPLLICLFTLILEVLDRTHSLHNEVGILCTGKIDCQAEIRLHLNTGLVLIEGFDGIVITDWGASNDHALGVAAGSNLEMPNPGLDSARELIEGLKCGKVKMSDIDERVDELLCSYEKKAKEVYEYVFNKLK